MNSDAVTRDIVINASPETVYDVVSKPEHIANWFSDEADFEPAPGARGVLVFREANRTMTIEVTVVSADRPHLFAFSWISPDRRRATPAATDTVLVEFRITPEPEGTRLVVCESGLDAVAWDDAAKSAYAEEHGKGWEQHFLPRLCAYAEGLAAQSPS